MNNNREMKPYERGLRNQGLRYIAGVDEVGRGPLAGPVVAAAVILHPEQNIPGLRDSKLLSASRRENLWEIIRKDALAVAVDLVPESVVDQVNILVASRQAMAGAVARLPIRPDYLLVDGLANPYLDIPHWPIVGGDRQCASIAAASIVAKVYRDKLMDDYHDRYPEYNFIRNKGYGTREHKRAIARFGPCPIHRRTFKGVKEYIDHAQVDRGQ